MLNLLNIFFTILELILQNLYCKLCSDLLRFILLWHLLIVIFWTLLLIFFLLYVHLKILMITNFFFGLLIFNFHNRITALDIKIPTISFLFRLYTSYFNILNPCDRIMKGKYFRVVGFIFKILFSATCAFAVIFRKIKIQIWRIFFLRLVAFSTDTRSDKLLFISLVLFIFLLR